MKILVYYLDVIDNYVTFKQEELRLCKLAELQKELPSQKIMVLISHTGRGDRIEMIDMTYYGPQFNYGGGTTTFVAAPPYRGPTYGGGAGSGFYQGAGSAGEPRSFASSGQNGPASTGGGGPVVTQTAHSFEFSDDQHGISGCVVVQPAPDHQPDTIVKEWLEGGENVIKFPPK